MKVFFSIAACFVFVAASAQIKAPAKWNFTASQQEVKVGDEIDLIFRANIDDTWHLYSTEFPCEDGPMKAVFNFKADDSYTLVGGVKPINPKDYHDKMFDCDVKLFDKKAEFRQRIKVKAAPLKITGGLEYQVCSETNGQCIPGDEEFSFTDFKVAGGASVASPAKPATSATPEVKKKAVSENDSPDSVAVSSTKIETVSTTEGKSIEGPVLGNFSEEKTKADSSLFGFFILSFLAGLAALLTPCVFPMIPMTVSFFTGRGTKTQAVFYGACIILIYTLVGALLAPLMGPETANHLSTEWIPNILFFLVFIIFGLSFLGLFEITLPNSFINKVDQQADKGGWGGVFFMAFTLVLVSFSCTGPLVGSILVSSAGGEVIKPIVGMIGFSSAFAIPFTLFAIFPGWLRGLPKSGGWLNTVKVVLGFLEIAFAFKFLSIADQAFHWGILDREINLTIWIVIATLVGLYLMKAFKMPGDVGSEDNGTVSVGRVTLASIFFVFTVYLIPGMWGAPLKALAGYLPPMHTHDFDLLASHTSGNTLCDEPKYKESLHFPHGIQGYFDYKQALECARKQNKPLFIDFTGHGCTNCREMEARVWSDPQVLKRLKEDFVVVALYVDDKTELPESEWYTSSYDNKVKKTIGKQNADLQIRRLNNNAQPFYVLVGKDERVLNAPKTYDLTVDHFVSFLEQGKKQFKEWY